MMSKTGGLILLNKPSGITSFQVLNRIKKELGTGKVGHTGTLDKFAEGLIVALSGKMTKLVPEFTGMDKRYEAIINFGSETDTLDPEGNVIASAPVPDLACIEDALRGFRGKIMQAPPSFSAIHINGKRAYERVRSGETVRMPEREVQIFEFEILSWEPPFLKAAVHCSKGTYIRSLARDLALSCGSRAYLKELKRTSVGPFSLKNAVDPDGFREADNLVSPWEVFDYLPGVKKIVVDSIYRKDIGMGKEHVLKRIGRDLSEEYEYSLFDEQREMLALIASKNGRLSYRFVC